MCIREPYTKIYVAEILSKQGYELFYYKKENSTLEQDFFVRTKKTLVPVEVKAKAGTAKSLSTLVKSDAYPDITTGIKFIAGNIGFQNNIYTFPYFLRISTKEISIGGGFLSYVHPQDCPLRICYPPLW
jgi:hypothetical protein